jgi:hypothetical protein
MVYVCERRVKFSWGVYQLSYEEEKRREEREEERREEEVRRRGQRLRFPPSDSEKVQ